MTTPEPLNVCFCAINNFGSKLPLIHSQVEGKMLNKIINCFFIMQLWCIPIGAVVVGILVMKPGVAMAKFDPGK